MPRNSSGTYSLPAGNPVVTGTTISSVWANTTLSDIGTAITDSLSRSGDGGMLAPLELASGAIGSPGLTWGSETTSGLYRAGAGDFRYSISATDVLTITATTFTVAGTLNVNGLSPNTFLGDITINSTAPQYYWNQTGAAVDNREWDAVATAESWQLRAVNDAHTLTGTAIQIERTGVTIDSVSVVNSPFYTQNGTSAAPSVAFGSDTDTGIYRVGADSLGISAGGTVRITVTTTLLTSAVTYRGLDGTVAAPGISFSNDPDCGLYRIGADNIGLAVNGANVLNISTTGLVVVGVAQVGDGSAAAPSFSFSADTNTGIFRAGADDMRLVAGAATALIVGSSAMDANVPFRLADGAAGTPSLRFTNDTDTGLYLVSANSLGLATGGTLRLQVQDQILFQDGSGASPVVSFQSDTNTGLFRVGADELGFATNGTQRLSISTSVVTSTLVYRGPDGAVGTPSLSFTSDTNTGLYSVAADTLGVATGGGLRFDFGNTFHRAYVPIYLSDGSAGSPSLAFINDTNSGIYLAAADQVGISANGANVVTFFSAGLSMNTGQVRGIDGAATANNVSFSFNTDTDTGMYRVGADQLGFSTGGTLRLTLSTSAITSTLSILAPDGGASAGSVSFSFSGDTDTGFYRTTADQIAIALGGANAGQIASGSFTGTLTGFTANPSGTVQYFRSGKIISIWNPSAISATSNSTSMTMTGLPAIATPNATVTGMGCFATDNGSAVFFTFSVSSGGVVTFSPFVGGTIGTWTNSGTKGLNAGCLLTYVSQV